MANSNVIPLANWISPDGDVITLLRTAHLQFEVTHTKDRQKSCLLLTDSLEKARALFQRFAALDDQATPAEWFV